MRSNDLRTNPELDKTFTKVMRKVGRMPHTENFSEIYDYAKRFQNELGFGMGFIERLYLLGYVAGRDKARNEILCDKTKLKARIVEKFGSLSRFAKKMGLYVIMLKPKFYGDIGFTDQELVQAVQLLEIPEDKIQEYFFTSRVPERFTGR